jgi:hypothetical protein
MFKTTVSCTNSCNYGLGVSGDCGAAPSASQRLPADKAAAPDQQQTRTFSAELRHLLAHLVTLR